MNMTRRRFLGSAALSGMIFGTTGCLSQGPLANITGSRQEPRVRFDGNVSTDEPLVEGVALSTETSYPNHYSAVIPSKDATDELRWEYIEDELSLLVDDLEATNYDSEVLLLFGMKLPRTKQLQSGGVTAEDGVLHSRYRIDSSGSASSSVAINTHIQRVEFEGNPDDVKFGVQF